MPPFKLESLKYNPWDKRVPKMLYCKKEYDKRVKITDWNMNLESLPIDTNPYNPKCFRLHNSHYDRLGSQDEKGLISETHEALRNGCVKMPELDHDPHKYLLNFYMYTSQAYRSKSKRRDNFGTDYKSTMQDSYQPPYPLVIKRLELPVTGNQNKRMASREECKFLDDNFVNYTRTLQEIKGDRHVSFNPCTGKNTEGYCGNKTQRFN
ncbi:uncharacterized protein LOC126743857 [Anthonomus grandis grandis]|uniref:uncharacterized protein LOC126743857 n=1 Tax=Anthonomus grandis grandis TaxID=2921223 RepID=UPI002166B597|nr:uncharacterized protein LOC126743857 [Anthonomus grandis grandis]